jgi:hypothetical protein
MFAHQTRPDADYVVVFLTDGAANTTMATVEDEITDWTTYPIGHCPSDVVFPLCQDEDISTRHPYTDTLNYDADDYARDMADYVGCDPLNPAPGCLYPGVGAAIFTVGIGDEVLNNVNEVNGLPYGVALLRYLAAVGDDGDPSTDPCENEWGDPDDWEQWCGNYYFAGSDTDLFLAIDDIFQRLISGLIR